MRLNPYGRTGRRVSAVGFGGMRFDLTRSEEENADLVRYACSKGINYFDTAPNYCSDRSESIFGLAFRDMPSRFHVSTKAMPVSADTAEKARESVMKSLDRLGVPKIHFFHVWCLREMEHFELAMRPGGEYEGLLACQEERLIDHIVFSSHQPGSEIRRVLETGKFEGVLMGVNILNFPYRWDGAQAAVEGGYGVVAMNPLAGGEVPKHADSLHFLSREGESPTEAALRFIIGAPQITVALVGFTDREQVDTACRVAENAEPFTETELQRIRERLGRDMDSLCTACGYCDGCPKNIPIPSYMQVYNERLMFSKTDEEMLNRVSHHLNWGILVGRRASAGDCIECGQCEEACTQRLDIVNRLKAMAEWERQLAEKGS